jgi:hypothetical protein
MLCHRAIELLRFGFQMKIKLLMLSIAMLIHIDGFTQNAKIYGVGGMDCGRFFEIRKARDLTLDSMIYSWLQGYLTAINYRLDQEGKQMWNVPEQEEMLKMVERACLMYPAYSVLSASSVALRSWK